MKSKIISLASMVIALGSVFMAAFFPRLARSLRKRGLQTTISLFIIKVKLTIDLFLPRTIWGERVGLRPINQSLTRAEVERVYKWSCDREILRWSAGSPTELNFDEFSDQLKRQRWHLQLNHWKDRSLFDRLDVETRRAGDFFRSDVLGQAVRTRCNKNSCKICVHENPAYSHLFRHF